MAGITEQDGRMEESAARYILYSICKLILPYGLVLMRKPFAAPY